MALERHRKRILQVTAKKFPPEIRVKKEAFTLLKAGYGSAVLCPPFGDQKEYEVWNGIEIFRPTALKSRSQLDKVLLQTALFSPAWYKAVRQVRARYQPNALHVHDIWLGRTVRLADSASTFVMDLHENMPAAVLQYRIGYHGPQKWFRYVFHCYPRIFRYERKLLKRSSLVLTVVKEARDRVLANHPMLGPDKVSNVENLESKGFASSDGKGKARFGKDHFSVLYIGGFGPHRGIDTLIRAMAFVDDYPKKIKVQLVGASPSQYLDSLKRLVVQEGVEERVHFIDWVAEEDVLPNILQADVCCVPHKSNSHTDSTIPHKLYQYMIAMRPVLVSSSAPLARTVSEAQAGEIFNAGDPADCADKIKKLAYDDSIRVQYSENGYNYVYEQGNNWEDKSGPSLIFAYDRLFFPDENR